MCKSYIYIFIKTFDNLAVCFNLTNASQRVRHSQGSVVWDLNLPAVKSSSIPEGAFRLKKRNRNLAVAAKLSSCDILC